MCYHVIILEKIVFERAESFVLLKEEMGGQQSSRQITSDGKCFSLSPSQPVQSTLSICFCLYQQSQKCEFECSSSHVFWQWLTIPVTSYLSNCCRWCQQSYLLQRTKPQAGQKNILVILSPSEMSWHVSHMKSRMSHDKDHPYEWIVTEHVFNTEAWCNGKMQSSELFIWIKSYKRKLWIWFMEQSFLMISF